MTSRTSAALLATLASMCGLAVPASAESPKVVARAGDTVLTSGAVERRLAALSMPQLEKLGGTPRDAPRHLVEQVLALEMAAELEARARGLERSPRVQQRSYEILRQALEQALRDEVSSAKPVTARDIEEYFEANRSRFEQPRRVRLWRILVTEEAQAERILAQARKHGGPSKWSELAREHSVDKATHMRHGDLGFVQPDGNTDVPRVRVDPALFAAVEALKDGQLAEKPVREGQRWAVVWRRGSLPATQRSLADETESIRQLLERRRVDEARSALLQRLRKDEVRAERPELLDLLPESLGNERRTQGVRAAPSARPQNGDATPPRPTERGLR